MDKNKRTGPAILFTCAALVFLAGALLTGEGESNVSPALVTAFTVTAVLTAAALLLRVFVIPKFQMVPGRIQILLEQGVGLFDKLTKRSSPRKEKAPDEARTPQSRKSEPKERRDFDPAKSLQRLLDGLGMDKKTRRRSAVLFICAALVFLAAALFTGGGGNHESIQEVMEDAVLHSSAKVGLFGLADVNPGLISAFTVTAVLAVAAVLLRIFVIPKFQMVPGRIQLLLEQAVGLFDGLAKGNSPHKNGFLSAYIFAAGAYIFVGTFFELFGLQAVTTAGHSITLPAPLSDINGAIGMGVLSYGVILSGGIAANGLKGVGRTLKEFSLPISMSFRLFGALLSGALVTELVYYYFQLSFVLPVIVGVLFTLLHALIQAYVLTMLTSVFYGEVAEPPERDEEKHSAAAEKAPAQS